MCLYVLVCACVCMSECLYYVIVGVCMSDRTCFHVFVCACVCMYVCM